jgi:copper homeostasis protein
MKEIMSAASSMGVTFHRAFDMLRDPWDGLEILVDLGVDRVLTSGQERSAPEGLDFIREAVERADGRISIMPGAGLNRGNVRELIRSTGVREIHFTAFKRWKSPMIYRNPGPRMGADGVPGEYERITTDPGRVREMLREVAESDTRPAPRDRSGPVRRTPGNG